MEDITQLLRSLLTQLPSLLVLLACLVIAIVRWKRHPKVSLVAGLAFAFLILHGFGVSVIYIWLPRLLHGSMSSESSETLYSWLALFTNFTFALGLAALLVAIFIDRKRVTEGSSA